MHEMNDRYFRSLFLRDNKSSSCVELIFNLFRFNFNQFNMYGLFTLREREYLSFCIFIPGVESDGTKGEILRKGHEPRSIVYF